MPELRELSMYGKRMKPCCKSNAKPFLFKWSYSSRMVVPVYRCSVCQTIMASSVVRKIKQEIPSSIVLPYENDYVKLCEVILYDYESMKE